MKIGYIGILGTYALSRLIQMIVRFAEWLALSLIHYHQLVSNGRDKFTGKEDIAGEDSYESYRGDFYEWKV